jgi:hypothetical protein
MFAPGSWPVVAPPARGRRRPGMWSVMEVAGQSGLRRERRGPRCHHPAPRRRQTIVILQFAICNLQSLFRRELFSRIRAIRVTAGGSVCCLTASRSRQTRQRLSAQAKLFGGKPKALPPAALQDAPLPRSPSATSRRERDWPATSRPKTLPRPSPETLFLWARSEAATLTA